MSRCCFEMSGPVSAFSSKGPPMTMPSARRTSSSTNFSAMDSSTIRRVPAEHTSPESKNPALSALSTAASKSASAKTIFGFLPPSSRATFFTPCAADSAIFLPVSRPPVKEIRSISGWDESTEPTLAPSPITTFATPAGRPRESRTSAINNVVEGVSSEGLITNELPVASAGAIFHEACNSGKFHGVIMPQTPIGS